MLSAAPPMVAEILSSPAVALPILLTLGVLYFLCPCHAKGQITNAPSMVTLSLIFKIPLFGQILESGKSSVKMTKRCYDEYGPVFIVPVSEIEMP